MRGENDPPCDDTQDSATQGFPNRHCGAPSAAGGSGSGFSSSIGTTTAAT